jgi:hypothetical protein
MQFSCSLRRINREIPSVLATRIVSDVIAAAHRSSLLGSRKRADHPASLNPPTTICLIIPQHSCDMIGIPS